MLVLFVGVFVLIGLLAVLTRASSRWAREAAAERWSTGLDGQPVPYEPIEHSEVEPEVLRVPDRPRRPW